MKKFLSLSAIALLLSVVLFSCKKEKTDDVEIVNLNVTLAAGATYNLDLSKYGDADDIAKIFTQAEHFDISEISATSGKFQYQYKVAALPKVNFNGTDKVVIKLTEGQRDCGNDGTRDNNNGRNGNHHSHDEAIITINFTMQ